mmetsp:Transcript_579/g.1258  ORF Transcript_579/g.1258 Transcript_579/m.1258 type:complete len:226 (+) Transcript_579:755-1432(+)
MHAGAELRLPGHGAFRGRPGEERDHRAERVQARHRRAPVDVQAVRGRPRAPGRRARPAVGTALPAPRGPGARTRRRARRRRRRSGGRERCRPRRTSRPGQGGGVCGRPPGRPPCRQGTDPGGPPRVPGSDPGGRRGVFLRLCHLRSRPGGHREVPRGPGRGGETEDEVAASEREIHPSRSIITQRNFTVEPGFGSRLLVLSLPPPHQRTGSKYFVKLETSHARVS